MDRATKHLINAMKKKREASGFSLRRLSEVTGVSFSTLSRLERFDGEPDTSTKIRIINWLGAEATGIDIPYEHVAEVHFRAAKSVDSKTVKCLVQIAHLVKAQYGEEESDAVS